MRTRGTCKKCKKSKMLLDGSSFCDDCAASALLENYIEKQLDKNTW